MGQIGLNIAPRLSYAPELLYVHSGIRQALDTTVQHFVSQTSRGGPFVTCYVYGEARTGKSHFSLALCDRLLKAGFYPRLIEIHPHFDWTAAFEHAQPVAEEVCVVDDVHLSLGNTQPGQSGAFVSFFETAKRRTRGLVLLSGLKLSDLPCDEHVLSRLMNRDGLVLAAPAAEELATLIERMAEQRGLRFAPRQIQFLSRRLNRTVIAVEEYLDRVLHLAQVTGKSIGFPVLGDAI